MLLTTGTDTVIADGRDPRTRNYNLGALNCDGSPRATTLIQFDLSAIPPWATVISASMRFDPVGDGTTSSYPVYESLRDWTEDGATWLEYAAGSPWFAAGGNSTSDHGATQLATLTGVGQVNVPLDPAGVAVVQDWISGARRRDLDEVIANRPQFFVTYREGRLQFRDGPQVAGLGGVAGPFTVERVRDTGGSISAGAPELLVVLGATSGELSVVDAYGNARNDPTAVEVCHTAGPAPAPAIASAATSSAECGVEWSYVPTVVGDAPYSFAVTGPVALDATTGAMQWTPTNADRGSHPIALQVTGPGGTTTQSFALEVACARDELTVICGCNSAATPCLLALLAWVFLRRRRS